MTTTNQPPSKKPLIELIKTTFIGGLIIILPAYLAILAFNKMLKGIIALIPAFLKPIASLIGIGESDLAIPIALIIFVLICFLAGLLVKTSYAQIIKKAVEPSLKKIPGYLLIRSVTNRMAKLEQSEDLKTGFVALGETNQSLSPAFLIEQHDDGSYTVFVPTVPTPTVGNLYLVPENRVFPLNIPFLDLVKFITRWGESSPQLLDAIKELRASKLNSESSSSPEIIN